MHGTELLSHQMNQKTNSCKRIGRCRKKSRQKKTEKCPIDVHGESADGANQDEIWLKDHYDSDGTPYFK